MLINADFSRRAIMRPADYHWVGSPQHGVERIMLDRIGAEEARATSLVRYAPDSYFPRHAHPGGEEILVLSGTFSEGQDHYSSGAYLRSPPGSSHQPFSQEGALIFVKLRQMSLAEQHIVRLNTHDSSLWHTRSGGERCLLFMGPAEQVSLERLEAGYPLFDSLIAGGAEILVLDGLLCEHANSYPRGTWLRLPPNDCPMLVAGTEGVTVYLKTGHLASPPDTSKSALGQH